MIKHPKPSCTCTVKEAENIFFCNWILCVCVCVVIFGVIIFEVVQHKLFYTSSFKNIAMFRSIVMWNWPFWFLLYTYMTFAWLVLGKKKSRNICVCECTLCEEWQLGCSTCKSPCRPHHRLFILSFIGTWRWENFTGLADCHRMFVSHLKVATKF